VTPAQLLLDGHEFTPVVGTSHYQETLVGVTGRQSDEEVRHDVVATLVPEPDNPHDPQAIAVHVDRRLVGYLSREENARWQDVVKSLAAHDHVAAAEGRIAGRGGTNVLGVFLFLPTPTEARAQAGIRFRAQT
jgi:hypothetical protein